MKYIIALLVMLTMSITSYADVVRKGNVITITKTTTLVNEKESIGIYYQDKDNNQYLIYKSKNDKYYIIKTSKKTGKEYKQYLSKKLQNALNNELRK